MMPTINDPSGRPLGRVAWTADVEDDDVPFAERFAAVTKALEQQFGEAEKLTAMIRAKVAEVDFNG